MGLKGLLSEMSLKDMVELAGLMGQVKGTSEKLVQRHKGEKYHPLQKNMNDICDRE